MVGNLRKVQFAQLLYQDHGLNGPLRIPTGMSQILVLNHYQHLVILIDLRILLSGFFFKIFLPMFIDNYVFIFV